MNIIDAIKDPHLFRPFVGDDLASWQGWITALKLLYGLPIRRLFGKTLVEQCTGHAPGHLRSDGFKTALFLTGRRSGKSRVAAIIGAYEAVLAGHEVHLSKGEKGVVPICAPSKSQGRIVKDYIRAIFDTPMLHGELARETAQGFELRNGNRIEILAGDFRTIRGFTLLAAIVDEACFFGYETESKIKSDTELIRAIRPSLATVGGRLICISSPYARKGWCWQQYRRSRHQIHEHALVWNCPSRTMNPTLPQSVIDEALAEDRQAAKSEYLGEFRDDVADFISRDILDPLVATGCRVRAWQPRTRYHAFADLSGGRADDAALAIAHMEERKVVVDLVRRWRPPFNPHRAIQEMVMVLRDYGISHVTGDNYAAEFVARAFESNGIRYTQADRPKSRLYSELLPRLCSGEIVLLDDDLLIRQLCELERRTRSGGRDIIDHPTGGHDDVANVVAGIAMVATTPFCRVGALSF